MTRYIYLIAFLLLGNGSLFAQQDFTLYYMDFVPQSMYENPAFIPNSHVNVGLPVMSSIYFNHSNSGFKYNDVIQKRDDDSLVLNMDNLISKLNAKNYLVNNFETDLLSFGFRVKENYFSFNATEHFNTLFVYPKDMVRLFWEGNGKDLLGERANLDGLGFDLMHYREYGFGYAREINEKLTIGGKVKYLYGVENIWTKTSELGLTTDTLTFDLVVDGQMEIHTSGFAQANDSNYSETPRNYLFGRGNKGVALDAGAKYQFNDKIAFSASVVDLGYIKWNYYTKSYTNEEIAFEFTGVDLNAVAAKEDTSVGTAIDAVADSLRGTFEFEESTGSYKNMLFARFHLGSTYQLNESSFLGGVFHGTFIKKRFRPGMALSYNYKLKKWLSASVNYSVYNRAWSNVGAGLSLNLGPIQLYAVTDNLLAPFVPHLVRNAHFHTGINLTFGRGTGDTDGDGIADRKDDCPEIKGLKKHNGCPDTDLDGIVDADDFCPTIYGLPEFSGCPDTDGDGIGDLDDGCIDVAGVPEFNGCPDTDSDGIADKDDECPEKSGSKEHAGCPDTDNDGLVDGVDECPDVPGKAEFFGCPETKLLLVDKDGNVIKTAKKNEDGVFVFKELPADRHYLFKIEGDDSYISDEMLILLENDGKESLITAKKEDAKGFDYQYLPNIDKSLALMVYDEDGNMLRKTFRDNEGNFVFENLPADKHYLFKLEGDDSEIPDNLKILLKNDDNTYMMTVPKKKEGGKFKYEFLPTEGNMLAILEEKDDSKLVILKEEEEKVVKKAFDNLHFNSNSAVISHKSYQSLDELAELLSKKSEWKIRLEGHTDNVGTELSNMVLSKRRAEAVEKYLLSKGIDAERTIVKYYGETKPIASNDIPEERQKNRRVEMEIVE